MNTKTRQHITVGAGAAIAIGSVMPWGTVRSGFGQISISGIEGDGVFTLIFGAAIVVLAFRLNSRGSRIGAMVLAGLSAVISMVALDGIDSVAGNEFAQVVPGMGLYLTVAAAAVAFVMPLMSVSDREQVAVRTTP